MLRRTSYGGEPVFTVNASYGGSPVFIVDPSYGGKPVFLVGCFPKSELVYTDDDTCVHMGSLRVGDRIGSWDVEKKKARYTAVTEIHKYMIMEIICFNNTMQVSVTHPLMVMENEGNGLLMPKWKVAFDINIGDCIIGADGKCTTIKSKTRHWYNTGIEVLNLSTDSGDPFIVDNFVVRANNARDNIEWADATITKTLFVA